MKSIFITIVLISIAKSSSAGVAETFKASKIVDDLISQAPDFLLNVQFDCGVTTLGNKFAPIQVRNRPNITWKDVNEDAFYTIIMTDSEGKGKEWLHWLIANIPGNNVEKGTVITAFFPSAPPKDTGEHLYVFLLFKQPAKINFEGEVLTSTFQMDGRDKFSTKEFVAKHKLGSPLAGNFYFAAWDESCNELYRMVDQKAKKN